MNARCVISEKQDKCALFEKADHVQEKSIEFKFKTKQAESDYSFITICP